MIQPTEGPALCLSCRAPIVWARMTSGKLAPMEIDDAGAWVIIKGAAWYVGSDKVQAQASLALEAEPPRRRYTNHFATCPDATAWRDRDA